MVGYATVVAYWTLKEGRRRKYGAVFDVVEYDADTLAILHTVSEQTQRLSPHLGCSDCIWAVPGTLEDR